MTERKDEPKYIPRISSPDEDVKFVEGTIKALVKGVNATEVVCAPPKNFNCELVPLDKIQNLKEYVATKGNKCAGILSKWSASIRRHPYIMAIPNAGSLKRAQQMAVECDDTAYDITEWSSPIIICAPCLCCQCKKK
jgi:hypothetical protein